MNFQLNRLLTWAFPVILVGAYVWSAIAATAATPIRVGEITDVKGSGWGLSLGNVKYDKLGGDTLVMDEVVSTGQRSAMTMLFIDKTVMTLGPNAEITIDEMVYNPEDSDKDIVSITLGKGSFYFVSGLVAKEKVTIVTPTATIGIRGTELVINIKEDGSTSVGVAKGHAFMRSKRDGRSVEVRVGYTGRVNKRGRVSKPFQGIDLTGEDDVDREIPGVAEWLESKDEKDEEDDLTEFSSDEKDDEDEKSADDEDEKKSDDAAKDDDESDSDESDSDEADDSDSDESGDGDSDNDNDSDNDSDNDRDSGNDDDGGGNDSHDSGTNDRNSDDDDD